ncbi:MAG: hypothetical protein OXN17_09170 [Candidatus Poribacteria bacterium]|nr:hypothetical protein [Candidatus Poribacteria bacterium]MDE0503415.1 hypothetical protein [Candidatus Poribacteria bacterium]
MNLFHLDFSAFLGYSVASHPFDVNGDSGMEMDAFFSHRYKLNHARLESAKNDDNAIFVYMQ